MKINILTLILALSISIIAQGQTIDIADYRAQVLGYSLSLKRAEIAKQKAIYELDKSLTLRLPALSLSGDFSYNIGRNISNARTSIYLQPQITQTLYGGGGIKSEIESRKLKCDITICDRKFIRLEVIYAADYAYWNLTATQRYRDITREYVEIIRALKSVIDRRFSEGYISKSDVLMMASRLSEAEYESVSADQNFAVALHNFNILRGHTDDEKIDLVHVDNKSITPPVRLSLSEILEYRPDYTAAQLNSDILETSIRTTKASYNPSLKIGSRANWQPHPKINNNKSDITGVAFAQFSTPIFHFAERKKAILSAQATAEESRTTKDILHDSIELEEANGWTTLLESQAQLYATTKSLNIASENLELSTYSYNEGQATILDVMQAQLSWIQIYTNSINAEFNYLVAISSYHKITASEE